MKKLKYFVILTNNFEVLHKFNNNNTELIKSGGKNGCYYYFYKLKTFKIPFKILIPYNNKKLEKLAKKKGTHLYRTIYKENKI